MEKRGIGRYLPMAPRITIISYFSLETDLAGEMRSWPEFVSGSGYDVELKVPDSDERVSVRYVTGDGENYDHVDVTATGTGLLFDRVLGRVIHALSAHSDDLVVSRH